MVPFTNHALKIASLYKYFKGLFYFYLCVCMGVCELYREQRTGSDPLKLVLLEVMRSLKREVGSEHGFPGSVNGLLPNKSPVSMFSLSQLIP